MTLPVPRLQYRWSVENRTPDPNEHNAYACKYELVLPLREFDIRNNGSNELVVLLSETNRKSTNDPDDVPFRDGAHGSWDAAALGGLPVIVLNVLGDVVVKDYSNALRN